MHLDAVARQYFREEAWNESPKVGMWVGMFLIYLIVLGFHFLVLPARYWEYGAGFSGGFAAGFLWIYYEYEKQMNNLFSAIIAAIRTPAHVRRQMKALHARDHRVVVRVCTFAVKEYRDQISSEHDRAIGIDSRWSRKRERVSGAADGAAGAVAFWTERSRAEPGSQTAKEQLSAASRQSRKLTSALQSLDQHADAIRMALLECRDKVDTMERRVDDVARIRQLGAVPHTAEGGRALADASVKAIAEELLDEAESVGAVLADLSRLASASASSVVAENVERLADEAVEDSERANEVVAGLNVKERHEARDSATSQSAFPETPSEPEHSVVETPESPPQREVQPVEPPPDPEDRIAELRRQRIAREADFERQREEAQAEFEERQRAFRAKSEQRKRDYEKRKREIQAESEQREREIQAKYEQRRREAKARSDRRMAETQAETDERVRKIRADSERQEREAEQRQQEIQAGFEQLRQGVLAETLRRRQEILTESLRRKQEILAKHGLDPPPTTPDPESVSFDRLGVAPQEHPLAPSLGQSASSETPSEPEHSVDETSEEPAKRETQPVEPPPQPEDRIAELRQRRMGREADFEQRKQEIRARLQQRRKEMQPEFERRRKEIRAKYALDPPATTPDPGGGATDSPAPKTDDPPQTPAPSRSTSSQTPARMSETEEEKQMKQLVGMLRRMADVQDRRAHDLRYRDEFNWEADDREELARKMTELADDIEMFQRLSNRMKDMEGGNPGT